MNTFHPIIALVVAGFSLLGALSVVADPIKTDPPPKRLVITLPESISLGGKAHKISKINQEAFVALFTKIAEAFNADSKQFGADASTSLMEIWGLKDHPHAKGVFAISPMFNRDMLVATVMVGNKIKLDDDDFERIKIKFAEYARKTENKDEQMLIAVIYGSLLAEWKHP